MAIETNPGNVAVLRLFNNGACRWSQAFILTNLAQRLHIGFQIIPFAFGQGFGNSNGSFRGIDSGLLLHVGKNHIVHPMFARAAGSTEAYIHPRKGLYF